MEIEKVENIAHKILSFKGNVKGTSLLSNIEYVRYREGEEGVEKVGKRMNELGVSIDFKKISPTQWISVGVSALCVLVIRETFNWDEDDIFDMGRFAVKLSFVTKLFINHFVSKEKLFKQSSKYWHKQFDFGSLEAKEITDKYAIMQIRGHDVHPLICHLRAGYMHGLAKFVVEEEKIKVEETKCTHRGDDCHEYKISLK